MLASAEESLTQVRGRASRIGLVPRHLLALEGPDVEAIEAAVERHHPALVVVDSLQSISDPELAQPAGSLAQVRACVERLTRMAKSSGVPLLLVGHVTKDGDLAGPRAVEHLVDTVLSFDGDRHHALRVLTSVKHRFGPTGEVGIFEMRDDGLRAVPDPGPLHAGGPHGRRPRQRRGAGAPGAPSPAGRGPGAARSRHGGGASRPHTLGLDAGPGQPARGRPRLSHRGRRAGAERSSSSPPWVASRSRSRRPTWPSRWPLASVVTDRALPPDLVAFGELGLAGEVRTVPGAERRLAEALARRVSPGRSSPPPR